MPVEVVGLKEAMKAMRQLQPTLDKELKSEIRQLLNPVVKKARGYVPEGFITDEIRADFASLGWHPNPWPKDKDL